MDSNTVKYIIDHYLHLVPFDFKSKLEYPYLQKQEIEDEKKRIAEMLLKEYSNEVFLNKCPGCGKLARTPKAKQCRFCLHDWH